MDRQGQGVICRKLPGVGKIFSAGSLPVYTRVRPMITWRYRATDPKAAPIKEIVFRKPGTGRYMMDVHWIGQGKKQIDFEIGKSP
jgi:hypothetical protein